MFDHPQVLAEDMVATIAHPTLGAYRGVSHPIKFGRTPGPAPFAAPMLVDVPLTFLLALPAAPQPGK